nr:MAG TPA: tRNA methyltransferase [Caudoviricetes sp.]
MGILNNISSAAYDLERGRLGELTPVARNFTIVRDTPANNLNVISAYRVFSYETCVARVSKTFNGELLILVRADAFNHSITTSKHVRCFLSALVGRIDWDALYKACKAENAPHLINVSQFTC